ncbi:MAG TPA: hypothetical protein VHI99_03180 [Vicinamibacterales bacterium]|jgi:hypothetical protein|nr:hypothetical protein [Vicinamibacterales bacterium]
MFALYRATLLVHILAGLVGLAAFWTPALSRKGGTLHMRAGKGFFVATCVIASTGLMMAAMLLIAPLTIRPPRGPVAPAVAAKIATEIRMIVPFLVYLVLITFTPVYHGVRVLATRRAPDRLRTPFHTTANAATIAMSATLIGLAVFLRQPVFAAMSPIGFLIGVGQLQFARRPYPTPMAWWYEHMSSMIGGGIAFHTAFLVLGAGRLIGLRFDGAVAVIPWILPTLIGIPASLMWVRYYRRKFGELEASKAVAAA